MIRKGIPSDVEAIVEIAIESVSRNPIPVIIDRKAIKAQVIECMGPAHFCWVSVIDGEVVGAVGAYVQPSFWHQRNVCSVLLYYTRVPGEGLKLIRQFARWVKDRPAIKVAVIEFEPETDPRLIRWMRRLGFTRESVNLSYVRERKEIQATSVL